MNSTKRIIRLLINLIIVAALIIIDQFTKQLAVATLKDKPAFTIIQGVFELNYLENRGAAFGMLQNQKILFIIIGLVMLLLVSVILYKLPSDKKFIPFEISLLLIASGAVGNMIDRISNNYVVDFFYFKLINFPIFNVADIYVTVSCIVIVILVLFVYKDADFDFLKLKKKKDNETN